MKIFQMQIWSQCVFALTAVEDLRTQLANADAAREQSQARYLELAQLDPQEMRAAASEIAMEGPARMWAPMQAFLTAVANISKALWGQGGKHADARAELRASLE